MELEKEFSLFKSWVPTNRAEIELEGYKNYYIPWKYYDYRPKEDPEEVKKRKRAAKVTLDNDSGDESDEYTEITGDDAYDETQPAPLLIISSISIDLFFRQFVSLCPKGYRIIAAEVSGVVIDSYKVWVRSLHDLLLKKLRVPVVHILGFELGGLLAQMYAARYPQCVESLILINPFCSNKYFSKKLTSLSKMTFSIAPLFLLKGNLLSGLPNDNLPPQVAASFDFVASCVDGMSRSELATQLALLYAVPADADPVASVKDKVMIILSAEDEPYRAYSGEVLEDIRKFYPDAQIAELKRGCGEFPQLTVADEVNMYIQIHLRKFQK